MTLRTRFLNDNYNKTLQGVFFFELQKRGGSAAIPPIERDPKIY